MTLRQWLFNQTPGGTLTLGNTTAQDGTAAASISLGGGSAVYNATAHQGQASALLTPNANTVMAIRLPLVATANQAAFSFYHRSASLPAATYHMVEIRHASGSLARIGVSPTGQVLLLTSSGATIATSAAGRWAINRWNRIELLFDNTGGTSAGIYTLEIYDGDSLTPLETLTGTTANLGTAAVFSIGIGCVLATSASWAHYFDSIQTDNTRTTLIGPLQQRTATADFTGDGTLTASVMQGLVTTANFTGSGTLSAAVKLGLIGTADFSGAGTLSAVAGGGSSATADFSGSGTLSAVADMLTSVSADFTGEGTLSVAAEIAYKARLRFTPPVEKFYLSDTHPLFRRVPLYVGTTILKENGMYRQVPYPVGTEEIDAAEVTYLGGHEYELTDQEVEDLTAAGYGAYIIGGGYGQDAYGMGLYGVPQEG